MEHSDSYSASRFSSNLLANLERLGGQRLCTEEQPINQRLEWLKEVIGREYANVDVGTPDQASLYNDMLIYPWQQGLRLSPIRSNAITIERLPKEPEHVSQDCYFGVLLTEGQYKLEQGGREVFLKPGEMTIYDATEPHRVTTPGPFSKVLISIPRFLLDERIANISRLTATKLSTEHGAGAITASMISSTINQLELLDEAVFQALSEPVLELFTLSLFEVVGKTKQMSRYRSQALIRVKQFIACNLTSTGLKADVIASALGLSVRYINNLFNKEGTSLMRYLTQQRLARSRHYLASALYHHLSITELAMQSGFTNMAHFSRAFRQAYGMSPRAYRYHCQNQPEN
ncbi:helix-turn-helix domain-containing protein [Methylophaga pinxianii]|uniref:helix-turn-helix domain-containing protein n=1 Tax=Methylophaga pinxianii TaxID=2881052 RepID=UPI001CF56B64|nr:helix-turn-helix domain-containing protein [Methylophaga pinxianii]MCB2428062.1 helix-turn-helix domain-containing protein [Methylophaga pinxianii]UPH46063.1 helix-turn-helix domain-containing protein [Methylophaga pinxianii]